MEKNPRDSELSDRLRRLVDKRYPRRGRFSALSEVSGISENKWKNFYYKKQEATQELVYFWCTKYPDEADWLTTGIEAPNQKNYPFLNRVAQRFSGQTRGDRLNWVIAEFAAPSGENLFSYLSEKNESITADEWAKVILKTAEPTADMIALVTSFRPHFTEWVMHGRVESEFQVDPSDERSIEKWREKTKRDDDHFNQMLKQVREEQERKKRQ